MLCGGFDLKTQYFCRQWNSEEGKFPEKTVHQFEVPRSYHVSWTPISENETFLIGGGFTSTHSSSILLKPGVTPGYAGFPLKYKINAACSTPDPETNTVVITGGIYFPNTASLYNRDGFVENFGNLNYPRKYHGCTSYVADKKRVRIFFSCDRSSSRIYNLWCVP